MMRFRARSLAVLAVPVAIPQFMLESLRSGGQGRDELRRTQGRLVVSRIARAALRHFHPVFIRAAGCLLPSPNPHPCAYLMHVVRTQVRRVTNNGPLVGEGTPRRPGHCRKRTGSGPPVALMNAMVPAVQFTSKSTCAYASYGTRDDWIDVPPIFGQDSTHSMSTSITPRR